MKLSAAKIKSIFNRKNAGYLLLFVIFLVLFLYLRFPAGIVKDYLISAVAADRPEVELKIGDFKPWLPPGLKMDNVSYTVKGITVSEFRIDEFIARMSLIDLFKAKSTVLLSGRAYGGQVQGHINYTQLFKFDKPLVYEIKLSDARLEKFSYMKSSMNRTMTGKFNGSLVYRRNYDRFGQDSGSGQFTITNGSYPLMENIFGMTSIEFSKIEGRFSIKGDVLKMEKLRLTGPRFNASMLGEIVLNKETALSPVTMTGTLEILGMGGRRVNVTVSGVLGNPSARLM